MHETMRLLQRNESTPYIQIYVYHQNGFFSNKSQANQDLLIVACCMARCLGTFHIACYSILYKMPSFKNEPKCEVFNEKYCHLFSTSISNGIDITDFIPFKV